MQATAQRRLPRVDAAGALLEQAEVGKAGLPLELVLRLAAVL
jgi:hypothetical protein